MSWHGFSCSATRRILWCLLQPGLMDLPSAGVCCLYTSRVYSFQIGSLWDVMVRIVTGDWLAMCPKGGFQKHLLHYVEFLLFSLLLRPCCCFCISYRFPEFSLWCDHCFCPFKRILFPVMLKYCESDDALSPLFASSCVPESFWRTSGWAAETMASSADKIRNTAGYVNTFCFPLQLLSSWRPTPFQTITPFAIKTEQPWKWCRGT